MTDGRIMRIRDGLSLLKLKQKERVIEIDFSNNQEKLWTLVNNYLNALKEHAKLYHRVFILNGDDIYIDYSSNITFYTISINNQFNKIEILKLIINSIKRKKIKLILRW